MLISGAGFIIGLAVIKFRIKGIEILAVQSVLNNSQCFSEPLEMDNLSCSEELNRLYDIRVIYKSQYIVIGGSRLLLCGKVLRQNLLLHLLLKQSRVHQKEIPQQPEHICPPYGQRSNLQNRLPLSVRLSYLW